jgi:hypothetical protein
MTIDITFETVTLMTYALSGTVALALHRDPPFIPLHCHFIACAHWLHFLYLTTSPHFHICIISYM